MNSDFINIFTAIAASTGIVSVLFSFLQIARHKVQESRRLQEINEKGFEKTLDSANITKLGNYLDNNLGKISISEYTSNKKIQKKVNNHIQTIISFIGTEEEINNVEVTIPEPDKNSYYKIPIAFNPIVNTLRTGQVWNALAQLRRHIEITLKDILNEYKIEIKEFIPPIQILSKLSSMNKIPPSAERDLKFVLTICNKAVHGVEISQAEAEEAIQYAIKGLDRIENGLTNIENRTMLGVAVGDSLDENLKYRIYYDPVERSHNSPFKYIGLYTKKAIVAVGKVDKIISCDYLDGRLIATNGDDLNRLNDEEYDRIKETIENTEYFDLRKGNKFFLVNDFYKTNYIKTSFSSLRGKKYFWLDEIDGFEERMSAEQIAKLLDGKTWG